MKFSELVRLLEQNGFKLIREKGSIRYYGKPGVDRLIELTMFPVLALIIHIVVLTRRRPFEKLILYPFAFILL